MIKICDFDTLSGNELIIRHNGGKDISAAVKEIIDTVKRDKDKALLFYAEKFDKARLTSLAVSENEFSEAEKVLDAKLKRVLETAAANIRSFHEKQVRTGFALTEPSGVVRGQKITPIEKIGVYVPGGTAAYPSTVLMNCI